MNKIMFNKRYGVEAAAIEGYKTKTRREEKSLSVLPTEYNPMLTEIEFLPYDLVKQIIHAQRLFMGSVVDTYHLKPRYKIGEKVAVAQSYKDCSYDPMTLQQAWVKKPTIFPDLDEYRPLMGWVDLPMKYHKGWSNKIFVIPDLMPHHIEITGIKVERIQDISDEDCLCEGVERWMDCYIVPGIMERGGSHNKCFDTPRDAFFNLYTKICGYKAWNNNPWVYVYSFLKID